MPLAFPLITLAILSFFPISLYLLRRALRGRQTGDHPACARCSFDLFNRPETSTRCPECGSDLTAPRAILPGTRRRRPALLFCSLTLLALTLVATVNLTYHLITDPRLLPLQPTSLLPFHFLYHGPLSTEALAELQSRIVAGRAPATAASRVIPRILALQANPKIRWDPALGTFIESLHRASVLPAADWTTYLQHAVTITARIRPDVRIGDPFPVELRIASRVGNSVSPANPGGYVYAACTGSAVIDGQPPLPLEPRNNPQSYLSPFAPSTFRHAIPRPVYATSSPGSHTAHISVELALGRPNDPPLKVRQSLDLPFNLHASDRPTVRVLDDPALRKQVARAIRIDVGVHNYISAETEFRISVSNSPCALAYDVVVRSGAEEIARGSFTLPKGSTGGLTVRPNPAKPLPDHVDLILRPNLGRAADRVDITEICGGEIIFPNVPTAPSPGYVPTPTIPQLPTSRP